MGATNVAQCVSGSSLTGPGLLRIDFLAPPPNDAKALTQVTH